MSDFKGFPEKPNLSGYTAIPNMFFDEILPQINNMSELKILLAVFRKTYGWVKEIDQTTGQPIYKLEDAISYSQFEELTGLSGTSVNSGINRAINNGFLEKTGQGNYHGTSSSYSLVTQGKKTSTTAPITPPVQAPPPKEKFKPQYLVISDDDVQITGRIGTPLEELTGQPLDDKVEAGYDMKISKDGEDMLNDIFGKPSPPTKPEKTIVPHQEIIRCWNRCYFSKLEVSYGQVSVKEHTHIKNLLKDYELPTLLKAIEFYVGNYATFGGTVPNSPPTLTIFYSWRKTIIPASIQGKTIGDITKPSRNAREFEEDKWKKEDGFFDN